MRIGSRYWSGMDLWQLRSHCQALVAHRHDVLSRRSDHRSSSFPGWPSGDYAPAGWASRTHVSGLLSRVALPTCRLDGTLHSSMDVILRSFSVGLSSRDLVLGQIVEGRRAGLGWLVREH